MEWNRDHAALQSVTHTEKLLPCRRLAEHPNESRATRASGTPEHKLHPDPIPASQKLTILLSLVDLLLLLQAMQSTS